jgi:UDP-3-O-[3-hydroxymyristoyl] N-acetylglucosamine deacetylase
MLVQNVIVEMRVIEQTTLSRPAAVAGRALHSGAPVRAVLRPANGDSGITFRRMDVPADERAIEVARGAVLDTRRAMTIANSRGASISTVEHVLAALSLAGVDNALIEIDGAEAPILDGSARGWFEAIERAGIRRLAAPRSALRIMSPIEVSESDRFVRAEPADGRLFDVAIDFPDVAIGAQSVSLDIDSPADRRRVASARTFCRLSEIEQLRALGLSAGGSLENAVVVDGDRVLNPEGLRDPCEFALHKALDLIGDLALAGAPIIGRITARKPGHDLNARFVQALLQSVAAIERTVIAAVPERLPA